MDLGTGLALFGSAKIVEKILGPTAQYIGEEIKSFTEKGIENCKKIFSNAKEKLGGKIDEPGAVPPKVLKGILQEGAFCDDELTAEYFGGVLASSRSEVSRDDRGAGFISLISRLTTYQIRTHFVFYHVIKNLFNGEEKTVSDDKYRDEMGVFIAQKEYEDSMDYSINENSELLAPHALWGLHREDLIGDFGMGPIESLKDHSPKLKIDRSGIIFFPTALGVELFLWAYGKGNISLNRYLDNNIDFPLRNEISIPKNPFKLIEKQS